jgi:hypothetical protein
VFRIAVVDRYLFARLNITQGKEENFIAGRGAHVSVRLAGMIDVGGLVASRRSVYGKLLADRDDLQRALSLEALIDAAFAPEKFASVGGNLLAAGEGDAREAALPVNGAFSDFQFL